MGRGGSCFKAHKVQEGEQTRDRWRTASSRGHYQELREDGEKVEEGQERYGAVTKLAANRETDRGEMGHFNNHDRKKGPGRCSEPFSGTLRQITRSGRKARSGGGTGLRYRRGRDMELSYGTSIPRCKVLPS